MKKPRHMIGQALLKAVNLIGFSFVWLLVVLIATSQIVTLYFHWSLSVFYIFSFVGIFLLLIGISKIKKTLFFAILTFFLLVVSDYISDRISREPIYLVKSHIYNPYFYLFNGLIYLYITGAITYVWRECIMKRVSTPYPISVYAVSFLIFMFIEYTIGNFIISKHVPIGLYLAHTFGVNIFYYDLSGFMGYVAIICMYLSLVIGVLSVKVISSYLVKATLKNGDK